MVKMIPSECFTEHRYDTKNRPDNSKLAKHFHEGRNINHNLNVTILQNNIKTAAAQRYHEDKRICKLKTLAQQGLKLMIMLKKCTIATNSVTSPVISFNIMFT